MFAYCCQLVNLWICLLFLPVRSPHLLHHQYLCAFHECSIDICLMSWKEFPALLDYSSGNWQHLLASIRWSGEELILKFYKLTKTFAIQLPCKNKNKSENPKDLPYIRVLKPVCGSKNRKPWKFWIEFWIMCSQTWATLNSALLQRTAIRKRDE